MPKSREEFVAYCLRKLGEPVIEVNVAPEQIEDRVDEALKFWRDYHYDGSESVLMKHAVTETDIRNGYIQAPSDLLGVVRIMDQGSGISSGSLLDYEAQVAIASLTPLETFNMSDYYMSQSHLALIKDVLVGRPLMDYNRHGNKITISNLNTMRPGNTIVLEVWIQSEGDDIWDDRWLQNYATALIKEQWGVNLTKFSGIQIMGGITFSGEAILQDAQTTRKELEEAVINSFGPGLSMYFG